MIVSSRSARASAAAGPAAPQVDGLLLGAPVSPPVAGRPCAWWALDDEGRDVVVQRVRPAGGPGGRDEASLRRHLEHPHVLGLVRVARCREGAVQVLGPAPGGSLLDLLEERGRLSPGEVVVLVAGVASALEALHEEGLAHGEVEASGVLVGAGGMPLLLGWGAARPVLAGRADVRRRDLRRGGPALGRPGDDVRALARLGLLALGGPGAAEGGDALAALLTAAAGAGPAGAQDAGAESTGAPSAQGLARACWELVAPVPLGSGVAALRGAGGDGEPLGSAATAITQRVRRSAARAGAATAPAPVPAVSGRRASAVLHRLLGHPTGAVSPRPRRTERPRRTWWVAGLAATAVVAGAVAVAVLPLPGSAAAPSPVPPPATTPAPSPATTPSGSSEGPTAAATPAADVRLTGNDAAAAVPALSDLRAAAISAADPALLAAVDVAGSPAASADAALIGSLAGSRVAGLGVRIVSAEAQERDGASSWVRVVSVVSAHRVVTGAEVTDVPEGAPVTSRLLLRREDGAWRVADSA